MQIDINYIEELDVSFNHLKCNNIQNYLPLYRLFFKDNKYNWNKYNLDTTLRLKTITSKTGHNNINALVVNNNNQLISKDIFLKYSPLLDPIKYLTGKYGFDDTIFHLPNEQNKSYSKIQNIYNNAYIDGFFSFLSSHLLNKYNFIHGLDYYGSFLANQIDFKVNIYDDFEYIYNSKEFLKNIDSKFTIDNSISEFIKPTNTPLKILEDIELKDIINIDRNTVFNKKLTENLEVNEIFTINSDNSSEENDSDINESDSNNSEDESDSDSEETPVYAYIKNFPVNIICLENCHDTLDKVMTTNSLEEKEWISIFMQIIMTLLMYQKTFKFTHNDLHTNNIMYIKTELKFLYYNYNNICYKVPTYGKVWKIIDFGRAIYTVANTVLASDSFFSGEDAYSQYNCPPFLNDKKKLIEPNYSFDLCRLGCCLYDFVIDENDDVVDYDDVQTLINEWCKDDNGKNILYKKSGEERYPDFKLYKMIARLVHNHTPEEQLKNNIFKQFKIKKKRIPNGSNIMSIPL